MGGAVVAFWLLVGCPGIGTGVEDPGTVVDDPTWVDVEPILVDRCAICHAQTPVAGAPDGFRLDLYESTAEDQGAADMVDRIVARAVEQDPSVMPPGSPLPDSEVETLARWAELGAPETPADLEAR